MFPLFLVLCIASLIISGIYFLLLVKVFKSKEIFLNIGICLLFVWLFIYFGGILFGLEMWLYDPVCALVANSALVILGHIILVYVLFKFFKSKNKKWLVSIFISIFLFYLTLPWYFQTKALAKWETKYSETAVKLSVFPQQKGYIYLHTAEIMGYNNIPLRLKYYEKAHKYLEYNASIYRKGASDLKVWEFAPFYYYNAGDFDKAIEIGKAVESYGIVSMAYIMKNDYQNALIYIDKANELNVQTGKKPRYNLLKANILRNLGREDEAKEYYKKELKYADDERKNPNSKLNYDRYFKLINEKYNNKNYVRENWEKQRAEFIAKGFVLE